MTDRHIHIVGARENTLRDLDLDLPKDRLILITGRSGSGKSSLAVGTIFAEAQRGLAEGFSSHVRAYLAKTHRPEVTEIQGLAPTVLIDPVPPRGVASSTLGTLTDLWFRLCEVFAAFGSPRLTPEEFLFNSVAGACPTCRGTGEIPTVEEARLIDATRAVADGAILHPAWAPGSRYLTILLASGLIDPRLPVGRMPPEMRQTLLWSPSRTFSHTARGVKQSFTVEGVATLLLRRHRQAQAGGVEHEPDAAYVVLKPCPDCGGTRLKPEALAVRLEGLGIVDFASIPLGSLAETLRRLGKGAAKDAVKDILGRVDTMCGLGLRHLSIDRPIATLSGGEAQRVKLARHLASRLSHMIFVVDEPTVGLHGAEVGHLLDVLCHLRDRANTVIVIDHHQTLLRGADLVLEMGPGVGREGGGIVAMGPWTALAADDRTLTAKVLSGTYAVPLDRPRRKARSSLPVRGASHNNLRSLDLDLPLGVLTCLVGVSGSGKTSLALDIVRTHPQARLIAREAPGGSARSVVATYAKVFATICKEFAAATGQPQALFRFNGPGACGNCGGLGFEQTDMHFLDAVRMECPVCRGMRYGPEALRHQYRGRSIVDVLNMTVDEAARFFSSKRIQETLKNLSLLGLGYLTLGRNTDSLSAGEGQRLSLVRRLDRETKLLILDEPARGLHPADVAMLLGICGDLLGAGQSLLVIEHNVHFASAADWIIELGPGAGEEGGRIVAQGTPADLARHPDSLFGPYLKELASG